MTHVRRPCSKASNANRAAAPASPSEARERDRWSPHLGLCSVTLRQHPADDVVAISRDAGLRCVEWGADVHAPPDDLDRLHELRRLTDEAGLRVASYGSYWRAGASPLADLATLTSAAHALGAPRIRVWAGREGSHQSDDRAREAVARGLREACVLARDHGLTLTLEFHPDTLTDTVESTLELLDRVADPALRTYWQPRPDERATSAVEGLRRLVPVLAGVHVFSWWPGTTRLPLAARADLWTATLDLLVAEAEPCDLLLEFVPYDDSTLVPREADTLRRLLPPRTAAWRRG
jgi:3-dehydroshikimate dehydratase